MNKRRITLVFSVLMLLHTGACTYGARVQVENKGKSATKITVRSSDGAFRHDFEELKPGAVSAEIEFDGSDLEGVNVDASDNHENGTVNLESGVLNVIEIYEDGTEPVVRVVED